MKTVTEEQEKKVLRGEYVARMNRVLDYIENHMGYPLSLEKLAEVANFSRFHFHRLFKAFMGEPLNRFILRIRVEKAATRLRDNPRESITDIALDCGFSGSAVFSRAFRESFGQTPTQWRNDYLAKSKKCKTGGKMTQTDGNIRQDFIASSWYIDPVTKKLTRRIQVKQDNEIKKDVKVEVVEAPELTAAYIRHIGPYKGDAQLFGGLFSKLMSWMAARGLMTRPDLKCMAVYHDNPDITEADKLRLSVCMTIPADAPVDGEIGKMTIPGGKYAVGHFELNADEYEAAWGAICAGWLPESGFQPDDRPCFELYLNDPKQHPQGKHIVDIYLPVRPM